MISIIGVCGKKYHGKDTVANYLVNTYGYTKIAFGDSLKDMLRSIFGFTDEQLYGNEKENIDPYWKVTPRNLMQFVGTDLMRIGLKGKFPHIGENVWIMSLQHKIEKLINEGITKIVISDVRFANEATFIKQHDGLIIKVIREYNDVPDNHISEKSFDLFPCDHVLKNNTLAHLYSSIDSFMIGKCDV